MSSTARRVADRVASREPAACTLIVDAQKLKAWCDGGDGCPVDLMVRDAAARTWKRSGNAELVLDGGGTWGALHQRFLSHLSQQTHKRLVDFDQHLDDVSLDYLNKHLQL